MAKTEKQEEEVIQEVKTEETPVEEQKQEEPKIKARILEEGGDFKLKPRQVKQEQKDEVEEVKTGIEKIVKKEEEEEKEKTEEVKENLVLEEISQEEVEKSKIEQQNLVIDEVSPEQPKQPEVVVPENLQDLVKFMEDTGGGLEEYVRLNADYSNINDDALLKEYYKNTKPHLNTEEITFLIEDNFQFDEDIDEPRQIKKKKLAFKEEIVKARKHLTGLKDQYYK